MHIQCDHELMNELGVTVLSKQRLASHSPATILGQWYATKLKILNSDFLMYVHAKSLYSTIDVLESSSRVFWDQSLLNLRGKVLETLSADHALNEMQMDHLVHPFRTVTVGHVSSRHMNRIIRGIGRVYQKQITRIRQASDAGEVRLWEIEDIINHARRTNLGDASPAEILCELVSSGIH